MKNKFSSTLAGATLLIAVFGLVSKGLGFFREVLFASIYGLSTNFDIYLVGAVLPLTINTIILCLGQNYIIPAYNKYKGSDKNLAISFIRTNFYLFILYGIFFSLMLYFLSNSIISIYLSNSSTASINTAVNIFNLFLLTIPLTSGISIIIAYQQSNFEFKYSVISQIIPNIAVLIAVFSFRNIDIYIIPIGFIIGMVLQLFFLLIYSKELFLNQKSVFSSFKKFHNFGSQTLIFIIIIESIGQLYIISDRYFYDMVSTGGISALNYAQTIFLLPVSIISIALSTALFPKLSEYYSSNINKFVSTLNKSLHVVAVIFIPITIIFLFWGNLIIKLLYERGKFLSADSMITNQVLFMLSISLFFYSIYAVLNKVFYTVRLIGSLLIITIIGILIKILCNVILVKVFSQNGLALSTTITYLYFFTSSLIILRKKNIYFPDLKLVYITFSSLLNSLISILIVTTIFSTFVHTSSTFSFITLISFIALYIFNMLLYDKDIYSRIFFVKLLFK